MNPPMASQLFGISPLDLPTHAAVAVGVVLAAASGFRSSSAWPMTRGSEPSLTAAFPASTGIVILTRVLIVAS